MLTDVFPAQIVNKMPTLRDKDIADTVIHVLTMSAHNAEVSMSNNNMTTFHSLIILYIDIYVNCILKKSVTLLFIFYDCFIDLYKILVIIQNRVFSEF